MTKDTLTKNIQPNGTSPDEKPDVLIKSDKELLEDFLNELDTGDGLVSIEAIEPEIRIDKFLWVIRQKEKELEKCKTIANESINRAQSWVDKKTSSINSAIEYLTGQMRNYLHQSKLKSLSVPNGNIGFRKQPDVLIIQDEELFFENANPSLLKHTEESYTPDIKAIKEYIKQSGGDLPKGIDLKSQDSKFYYKLNEL